jgi:Skp family chaperone for outer membrane proteins
MQTEPQSNVPTSLWSDLKNRLFQTHPALKDLSDIRRAQLVMVFSLILELSSLVSLIGVLFSRRELGFVLAILVSVGLLCLLVYAIGRTQYYKWGAWLIITAIAGAGYLLFGSGTSQTPTMVLFIMLPIALTLSAGLLSVREQIIFLLVNVVLVGILPFFTSLVPSTVQYAGIFLAMGILLLIISAFRSSLEQDQFQELNRANKELHTVKDNLEELVRIGTESAEAARAETAATLETLQERTWFLNAEVILSEALRGEQGLENLAKHAMQALCTQTEIPVGAFFLFSEGRLDFLGGFAYLPNEQSPSHFQLGEGLVGQAAVERRKVFLKNIPASYFDVISGLGDAVPSQLILLPCVYNQKLIGVIEVGLLHDLSDTKMQFLDAAVENISVAMQTASDRRRISELLAETQAQTEELQSREEELRAINEELEAQAESLRQVSNRTS